MHAPENLMSTWSTRLAGLCSAALVGLATLTGGARAAPPEPVRIATSQFPPYVIEGDAVAPGALLEIVQELLRRTQIEGTIAFVPWRRAILLSTTQHRAAIFPLSRTPQREAQYRWLARLYHERFVFMSIKGGHFDVNAPERHKTRRVGVLRGSVSTTTLRELGYTNIIEAASMDEELRFLRRGIVDAAFGDLAVLQRAIQGAPTGTFVTSEPQLGNATWLGGSLDFTEEDAALFAKARKEMLDDGSYAQILKKYGLAPPWPRRDYSFRIVG